MNRFNLFYLFLSTAFLVVLFWRQRWLARKMEMACAVITIAFSSLAIFSANSEEFWRYFTAMLFCSGAGLELAAAPWRGKARFQLQLALPAVIFALSAFYGSSEISAEDMAHLNLAIFVLAALVDVPILFREQSEKTSAHPLRGLRVAALGALSFFSLKTYFPLSVGQSALGIWRDVVCGLGLFLAIVGFGVQNFARKQLIYSVTFSLLSLWGIFSIQPLEQFAGLCLALVLGGSLLLAGDESIQELGEPEKYLTKLNLAAVPGGVLFSAIGILLLIPHEPTQIPAHLWFLALGLGWVGLYRDIPWTQRSAPNKRKGLSWKWRAALFLVLAGSSILVLLPEAKQVLDLLQ